MSVIHYEHFDLYGAGALTALVARGYNTVGADSPPQLVASLARTGSTCLRCAGFSTLSSLISVNGLLGGAKSVVGQGAAIRMEGVASSDNAGSFGLIFGTAANLGEIRVVMGASGRINIYQGTTLRASSAGSLYVSESYFWLEARVTAGTGTGEVVVRLNGVQIVSATGLTIDNITRCSLGKFGTNQVPEGARFDDWVIWDTAGSVNNTWMGDTFIIVAAPNADSTPNQWVPSTGTAKWAVVDEATPDDADFLTGNAVADAQEFAHVQPNLPVGAVAAIATQIRAFKTDAGSSSVRHGISSNGQLSMSAEVALATGVVCYSHIANVNPDGNVPWTQAAAQAARLRLERVA